MPSRCLPCLGTSPHICIDRAAARGVTIAALHLPSAIAEPSAVSRWIAASHVLHFTWQVLWERIVCTQKIAVDVARCRHFGETEHQFALWPGSECVYLPVMWSSLLSGPEGSWRAHVQQYLNDLPQTCEGCRSAAVAWTACIATTSVRDSTSWLSLLRQILSSPPGLKAPHCHALQQRCSGHALPGAAVTSLTVSPMLLPTDALLQWTENLHLTPTLP